MESRTLLAISKLLDVPGHARELTIAGDWVFYGVDPELNNKVDYIGFYRTNLNTRATTQILPPANQAWDITRLSATATLGDRALFVVGDSLYVADAESSVATRIARGFLFYGIESGVEWKGAFYFAANDGKKGNELFRTDGTAQGTYRVADLNVGGESSYLSKFLPTAGALYINAYDGTDNCWYNVSNSRVRKLQLFDDPKIQPEQFAVLDDRRMIFSTRPATAGHLLWSSDGTIAGTKPIGGKFDYAGNSAYVMRSTGSNVIFSTTTQATGSELWMTDGNTARMVRDLVPGPGKSIQSVSEWLGDVAVIDGDYYFSQSDKINPNVMCSGDCPTPTFPPTRIMKVDGDTGELTLLRDGIFHYLTDAGDRVYFTDERSIISTDGTKAGTIVEAQYMGVYELVGRGGRIAFANGIPGKSIYTNDPAVGAIRGKIFADRNGDGVNGAGEVGVAGVVFLDANANGVKDSGELEAAPDSSGNFEFLSLKPGRYTVAMLEKAGWKSMPPITVTVQADQISTASFAQSQITPGGSLGGAARIALHSFDTQVSKKDKALPGVMVWLDYNENGTRDKREPGTLTDANGVYSFTGLELGNYKVRAEATSGAYRLIISPEQRVQLYTPTHGTGPTFGYYTDRSSGVIKVNVINDTSNPGTLAGLEKGLANIPVYIDRNRNGQLDSGEPSLTTDAYGKAEFTNLPGKSYVVGVAWPEGYVASTRASRKLVLPSDESMTVWFGGTQETANAVITGSVFIDYSRNGSRTQGAEPGLRNVQVYIDLNNNAKLDSDEPRTLTNKSGDYSFTKLKQGKYTVRATAPDGYDATSPIVQTASVWVGEWKYVWFGLFPRQHGTASLTGYLFSDGDGDGIRDPEDARVANGGGYFTSGRYRVFLDVDGDNAADPNERIVTLSDTGRFGFDWLEAGNHYLVIEYYVRYLDNIYITHYGRHTITIADGQQKTVELPLIRPWP